MISTLKLFRNKVYLASSFPVISAVTACWLLLVGTISATSTVRLESSIYVLKNADFQSINLSGAKDRANLNGALVRSPGTIEFGGKDYHLMLLLKVTPEKESTSIKPEGDMTEQEFVRFAGDYYRNPQPELIARAIASMGPTKYFNTTDQRIVRYYQPQYTGVGFFAEVFRANPNRVEEWQQLVDKQDGDVRFWMRKTAKLREPGAILALERSQMNTLTPTEETFVIWGAFCASGNSAYVEMLIDRLGYLREGNESLFDGGAQAMLLLATNQAHHPLVRQALEAEQQSAHPPIRELIDEALNNDLPGVLKKLGDLDVGSPSDSPASQSYNLPWRRRHPIRTEPHPSTSDTK